jgi:hypothetical protein
MSKTPNSSTANSTSTVREKDRPAQQLLAAGEQRPSEGPAPTTALALPSDLERRAAEIDRIATECSAALEHVGAHAVKALIMARAIKRLREAFTPEVMAEIMPLMNTAVGFRTDRPNRMHREPYSIDEVRECIINATLRGAYYVGNEFNIILGSCHLTLEYWQRKAEEIPGITDLRVVPGTPTLHQGQMVCRVAGSWKLNGVSGHLKGTDGKPGVVFTVIQSPGMSLAALQGKAKRAAYKMIHTMLTGTRQTEPDDEIEPLPLAEASEGTALPPPANGQADVQRSRTEEIRDKLAQAVGAPLARSRVQRLETLARELRLEEGEVLAQLDNLVRGCQRFEDLPAGAAQELIDRWTTHLEREQ